MWLVHKAIYPSLWSEERTEALTKLTFTSDGEPYSVLLSQIHRSLSQGATAVFTESHEVVAMSGVYVDDFLTAGPSPVVRSCLATLRKMWKTVDPQYLTLNSELPFLGVCKLG